MMQSLFHMFADRVARNPSRTALLFKKNGTYQEISWADFAARVRQAALGLSALGVLKGDKICLLSENRPEWAIADLGILSLGAVNVPIYPTSSGFDIEYILNHSGTRILILSGAEQYEKVRAIRRNVPLLKHLIFMDPVKEKNAGDITMEDLWRSGQELDKREPALYETLFGKVKPEDLATIIYTSGTTGQPKGAMLTHRNFLSNIESCAQVLPAGPEDRSLSFLPLSHVFERMAGFYFMVYQGVSIAYAENMNTVPQNLLEVRPTVVASVPRLYEKMYAKVLEQVQASPVKKKIFDWSLRAGRESSPYRISRKSIPLMLALRYRLAQMLVFRKIKQKLGGRLRFFISGGAPLSREIAEFFYSADILILEGYGLTETSPVVSFNRLDHFKFGTVGMLLPGVEVKIAEDGEILVKGPNVMLGYFRNGEETAQVIRDGWFYTGDIGEFDRDGFLKITGRKKELIVTSGGKKVAPQKIENLLAADEYILQLCVCGEGKNYITALIVPDFSKLESYALQKGIDFKNRQALVRNAEVQDFIRERIDLRSGDLAGYEKIKYFTLLGEEFMLDRGELTPTLKLKRKFITEKYRPLIEAMYEAQPHPKPDTP